MTPTLYLSCAVSADGYLDDISSERAILSSSEDLEAVLALRAQMDMIVIGAETLRRDDPSLATRGATHIAARKDAGLAPHPIKLVVTGSGQIPHERAFFRTGDGEKIILTQSDSDATGTMIKFKGDPIQAILKLAEDRGLKNILIEGGAQILTHALPHARFLRLAISPRRLSLMGHARFIDDMDSFLSPLHIARTETLGGTLVHHIDLLLSRVKPIMAQAFALSENCPHSDSAFAVGSIGCDADLSVISTGYSRETGPHDHAEEAMLSKTSKPIHTAIVTLEPCLSRASKPTGCAQRLVEARVKRVIYGVAEDNTFTQQRGLSYLRDNGVDVIHLPGFDAAFRAVNSGVYDA